MRTPFWLIALVLAAAGGIAVGYSIAPRTGQAPRTPEISTESGPDREGTPPLADDAPLTEEDDTPATPPSRNNEVEQDAQVPADDPLDELFDVELPPAPTGDEVITTRLVDTEGRPVSGVEVRFTLHTPRLDMEHVIRDDYDSEDAYIRAMLRRRYAELKMRSSATQKQTSDANGEVVFDGLPEGKGRLAFNDKRYHVRGRTFSSYSSVVDVGDSIELVLLRVYPLEASVRGLPDSAKSCRVAWAGVADDGVAGDRSFIAGKKIFLYLPAGEYDLTVEARIPDVVGGPHRVTVSRSDTPQQVELTVERNASIYGTIRFQGARPAGYQVLAARVVDGASDKQLLDRSRASSPRRARIDEDTGEYHFERELDGQYAVGVVVGRNVVSSTRIAVGGDPVKLDLDVELPSHTYSLRVVVNRPDGSARESDREFVSVFDGERGRQLDVRVWVDDDDNYLLLFDEPDPSESQLPDTAYVTVNNYELGKITKAINPSADREVFMEFVEPVEVYLWIKNLPEGLSWVQLRIWKAPYFDLSESGSHSYRTGSSAPLRPDKVGAKPGARLGMYQPGEYRFGMFGRGAGSFPKGTHNAIVKQGAGEQRIVMELPQLSSIRIDASNLDNIQGVNVRHIESGVTERVSLTGKGAVVRHLPPGDYEAIYAIRTPDERGFPRAQRRTVKFTLPGTETVVLTE